MSTVFSKVINGDLPGRFVYRSSDVVAFLSIEPLAYGHVLVVPVEEVDKWTDMAPELWARVNAVAYEIGNAVIEAFDAPRAGNVIAGFEVPTHTFTFSRPAAWMISISPTSSQPIKLTKPRWTRPRRSYAQRWALTRTAPRFSLPEPGGLRLSFIRKPFFGHRLFGRCFWPPFIRPLFSILRRSRRRFLRLPKARLTPECAR